MVKKDLYTNKIDQVCSTLARHIIKDGAQAPNWPYPIFEGDWYLYHSFTKELYRTINKLKSKGKTTSEIAKLFKAPSRIAQFLYSLFGFQYSGLYTKQRINLIEDLLKYISYYRKDPFCRDGKNIILSEEEVQNILQKYEMVDLKKEKEDRELRQIIGKINAILWLYVELINVEKHPCGHEFHGPYSLGNNNFLIVREYYDLAPAEIWPFTSQLPFNKIVTLEVYEDVIIKFDFFNHTESKGSLPLGLKKFLVGINTYENSIQDLSGLEDLYKTCKETISKAEIFIRKFNKKEWREKLIEVHYYYLKPHKQVLGEDWHFPERIFEKVETEPPNKYLEQFVGLDKKMQEAPTGEVFHIIKNILKNEIYGKTNEI